MQIVWERTREERTEVMLWMSGQGPMTDAVKDACNRNSMTFGIALVTREMSANPDRN